MSLYGEPRRRVCRWFEGQGFTDVQVVEGVQAIIDEEMEKVLKKYKFIDASPIWDQDAFLNAPSSLNECLEYFADKTLFTNYFNKKGNYSISLQVNRDKLEDLILGRAYISELVLYRPGLAVMIFDTESTYFRPAKTLPAKVFFRQVKTRLDSV